MSGRGVNVEGTNNGRGLEQGCEYFIDPGVLLPLVAFGILFAIPEAERQDMIRFGVRHQNGLVHEFGATGVKQAPSSFTHCPGAEDRQSCLRLLQDVQTRKQ